MYVEIMVDYKNEVEKYCIENNLSVEKVFDAPCAYNNVQALLHHVGPLDELPPGWQWVDDTPAPITLAIYLEKDGTLRFEQTEITRKYLGNEACVGKTAMANA